MKIVDEFKKSCSKSNYGDIEIEDKSEVDSLIRLKIIGSNCEDLNRYKNDFEKWFEKKGYIFLSYYLNDNTDRPNIIIDIRRVDTVAYCMSNMYIMSLLFGLLCVFLYYYQTLVFIYNKVMSHTITPTVYTSTPPQTPPQPIKATVNLPK